MKTLKDFENRLQEFNKEFAEFKKPYMVIALNYVTAWICM